ncbi:hypothetical protein [Lederbergia lenta]|uniref:hypothetical protein n=1 Tax=Lederbergia lenta TaxID=1467 RepID=UPI00203C6E83|nr:hypothetical protein [Lederbergia lenta]MCM3109997.1 hypothetical protein [Lederbergia lenta]
MRKGNEYLANKVLKAYGAELVISEMEVYDDIREFVDKKRTDMKELLDSGECEVDLMNKLLEDVNTFELEGTYIYCEVWDCID